ncbi:MAG TPA: hypothetical protein VJ351_06205 [Streptosporangiaceae bacterium]|nr:hypothetical protein [Streptosporangiaceae bacterium]
MAIVVLVLWLFTAGAGFYLLFTSNLSRARPAGPAAQPAPTAQPTPVTHPAAAATAANATATAANAATGANASATAAPAARTADGSPSRRAARRAARERWDPPSLVAARQAPVLPARSLVEFAHPTGGIIGLAFWLGFTLVHNRALGWIGFGLAAATACVGLGWFTANTRAARRANPARPAPSFVGRLAALHGSAAALTVALAALAVLVLRA